jgi:prepilin-type N-terminal cleavage/methylation domain-containing protein
MQGWSRKRWNLGIREISEHDRGFSLIELLVAISLVSIMSTLSLLSYRGYNRSQDHRGSAREVVAILRNTQVRAVTEATRYRCAFTTTDLTVFRYPTPPATPTLARTYSLGGRFGNNLRFAVGAPNGFTHTEPGFDSSNCFFYARGTASAGTVEVERIDNGARHKIKLEQLTARVSYED